MTLAVSVANRGRIANKYVNELVITLSSNYSTGGESFTANAAGLSRIDQVFLTAPAGYVLAGDIQTAGTSAKVQVYHTGTATEAVLAQIGASGYPNALTNGVVKAVVYGV